MIREENVLSHFVLYLWGSKSARKINGEEKKNILVILVILGGIFGILHIGLLRQWY